MNNKKIILNNKSGWTLIELLIVLCILGLVIGIFITNKSLIDEIHMNLELNNFKKEILINQSKATELNLTHRLSIDYREGSYFFKKSSHDIVTLKKFKSKLKFDETGSGRQNTIVFYKSGNAGNARICLKYKKEKIIIKITPVTGKLKVEREI